MEPKFDEYNDPYLNRFDIPLNEFNPVDYFSHYRRYISRGAVIVGVRNPTVSLHKAMGCHRWIGHLRGNIKGLWSSLWVSPHVARKDAETYWSYILDPEKSPWRSILQGVQIVKDAHGNMLAFFIPADNSYPVQAVVNLCVATRLPWEHPNCVRSFMRFRAEGFTDAQALFAMVHVALDSFGNLKPNVGHVHFAYDFLNHNMRLHNFENGTMPGVNHKLMFGKHDYVGGGRVNYDGKYEIPGGINVVWDDPGEQGVFWKTLTRSKKYDGAFPKRAKQVLGPTLIVGKHNLPLLPEALKIMRDTVHAW